jgi:hypothetical protein
MTRKGKGQRTGQNRRQKKGKVRKREGIDNKNKNRT